MDAHPLVKAKSEGDVEHVATSAGADAIASCVARRPTLAPGPLHEKPYRPSGSSTAMPRPVSCARGTTLSGCDRSPLDIASRSIDAEAVGTRWRGGRRRRRLPLQAATSGGAAALSMEDTVSTEALELERKLNKVAWALTAVVLLLVGLMRAVRIPSPIDFGFLPPLHAALNGLTAVSLVAALFFVKRRQIARHRAAIFTAFGLSIAFLLSYVVYHFTTPEVRFGDLDHNGVVDAAEKATAGSLRLVYLGFLATHVTLAGLVLPFILLTFNRAFTGQNERHRAMARWVFPVWLYVAVSGPVCYLLLRPYYPLRLEVTAPGRAHRGCKAATRGSRGDVNLGTPSPRARRADA